MKQILFSSLISKIKELGSFGPLVLFTVLGPALGAFLLVISSHLWLKPLQDLETYNIFIFFILTTLLTGLSLIPTHATSLIAGMLFGSILGPSIALFSVVTASVFGYNVMSRLIKANTLEALTQSSNAQKVHRELFHANQKKTTLFICLLRLSPIMPFAAINLILSTSKASLYPFTLGSAIGLAPRVILVALAGVGLNKLDLSQKGDQVSAIIGLIATLLVIAFTTRIVKKALQS